MHTHILNKRLTNSAEQEEKILEQQVEFMGGYSTMDHIFTVHGLVVKHLQKYTKFYLGFVILKKAFDSVYRTVLCVVLRAGECE